MIFHRSAKTLLVILCLSTTIVNGSGFKEVLAGSKPLATIFESGNNDLILLQKGELPDEPSKSDTNAGNGEFGQRIKQRLVTICLQNAAVNSGVKAFDIRKNGQPRYVAQPGVKICGKFEPTHHTLYFWKTNKAGRLSLTLSNRLDLGDTDGTQVNLTWVRD